LIIGFGVSVCLLRFYGGLPTRSPILKAVFLSLIVTVQVPDRRAWLIWSCDW